MLRLDSDGKWESEVFSQEFREGETRKPMTVLTDWPCYAVISLPHIFMKLER